MSACDIRVVGELLRAVLRPPDLRTAVILVDVVQRGNQQQRKGPEYFHHRES